ncbi:Sec-independent protein translocase subunit TatA [Streptomyces sp. 796.1]|uniref:Sec-independent protein translocase subunit TatA n=1 Tax=Streptomyces sp. 796.1 TaxID=3163029 RepID=UPI0039C8CF76
MFRNALQPWHLLMVGVVVALVFGSKKLPDTARALGKSLRILKSEARAMREEDAAHSPTEPTQPAATPTPRTIPSAPERPTHPTGSTGSTGSTGTTATPSATP